MPHEYVTSSGRFQLNKSLVQLDDYRGGIGATITDQAGALVASLRIYCHPDFPGFEGCAALTPEQMLDRAAERLQQIGHDAIVIGESSGASVGLFLNPPEGLSPNTSFERTREG